VTDLHERLRANLEGRYAIERELGRGGMATVFLARDLRHDRPVALKVLHADLAAQLGPERFQREIRFAARLQHPHILTVLDSGESEGQLWFTMPFVEGETLRARINRERQLPVADALRIAREAASALEYAHRHDVIHRDIKPENLLLTTDDQVLVADFGIARALTSGQTGEAPDTRDGSLTETGISVGTPTYMSPEQASGDRALDGRTDVYSLGAVLYEMLAGEPPFTGPTAQAIVVRKFTESARPLHQVRDTVSEATATTVARALARAPADRFASAAEFARALEVSATTGWVPATRAGEAVSSSPASPASADPATARRPEGVTAVHAARRHGLILALMAGFAIGLGVLFAWRSSHDRGGSGAGSVRRVAVVPFENVGDSADGYFADGLTDAIRGKLIGLPGLEVTARSSSAGYKSGQTPVQQIGRELGVEYVLTGTVRWDKHPDGASRVLVRPELIEVSRGAATWQQPFDAALADVFRVQADIAARVADALNLALGTEQRKTLAEKPTGNLAAYDAFLKGEAASAGMSTQDPPSLTRAIRFYREATGLDSAFVPAWSQLARAYAVLYRASAPSQAVAQRAREAAERARRLAPNRADGFLALGDYQADVLKDERLAFATYEAGIRLAPDNVDLLTAMGQREQSLGRWESAATRLGRAAALDPRSPNAARRYAYTLIALRRYGEAQAAQDRALTLAPADLTLVHQGVVLALARGDLVQARAIAAAPPAGTDPDEFLAYFATYEELAFVLGDAQQRRLLTLSPDPFAGDRGAWGLSLAQVHRLRGDAGRTRAYADSARTAFEDQLREAPQDGQVTVLLGHALALAGRKAEAIRAGERAVELLPSSRDAFLGPYVEHQLARIYILAGEPEKALDRLEPLLKMPYTLSRGWLAVDPTFDPLRKHPRFQRLIEGGTPS
jgi:serine/threonine-protein kinase